MFDKPKHALHQKLMFGTYFFPVDGHTYDGRKMGFFHAGNTSNTNLENENVENQNQINQRGDEKGEN